MINFGMETYLYCNMLYRAFFHKESGQPGQPGHSSYLRREVVGSNLTLK